MNENNSVINFWPWLFLAMASFLYGAQLFAQEINLDLRIEPSRTSDQPNRMFARVSYSLANTNEQCFYIPYNDPRFHKDRHIMRSFDLMLHEDRSQPLLRRGHISPRKNPSNWQLEQIRPHLWKVSPSTNDPGPILFELNIEVPHPAFGDQDEWFFDGFYPVPLENCPKNLDKPRYFKPIPSARFSGQVLAPRGWTLIAPSAEAPIDTSQKPVHVFSFTGREYSFALMRGVSLAFTEVSGNHLNIVYRNSDFLELKQTLAASFSTIRDWLGEPPNANLYLVETRDLQNPILPGIITINRPRQAVMTAMQSRWLNWSHWAVVTSLTAQWFGGSLAVSNPDDEWLMVGFRDFLTLIALDEQQRRFNFFGRMRGRQMVSLTYKELQEIQAALLQQAAPHVYLTDSLLRSSMPSDRQNPMAYIRHSMLLRQMNAIAGTRGMRGLFRRLVVEYKGQNITPADFHEFAASLPSPLDAKTRERLQQSIEQWWTLNDWPDLSLASWESSLLKNGRWLTQVEVKYLTEMKPPADVIVSDGRVDSRLHRAEFFDEQQNKAIVSFVTDYEPNKVVVDPLHVVYDANRFNNASGWPSVSYFPGDATGVSQDGYTVVWLPFPLKRPGEPFVFALQAAVLRFIHSATLVRVEYAPASEQTAFNLAHKRQLARALDLSLLVGQDLRDRRLADLSLLRNQIFGYGPNISLGLSARVRELANVTESRHQSVALNLQVRPARRNLTCQTNARFEHEKALKALNRDFHYDRSTAEGVMSCSVFSDITGSVRAFRGKLSASDETPQGVGFYFDDLHEARIRYDFHDLSPQQDILTINLDTYFPLRLLTKGSTMMLSRRLRGRLFYDYGLAYPENTIYRAAGWGFMLPFGGDLVGVGELSIIRLSLLVASYAAAGDERFHKPTILFDISGDL